MALSLVSFRILEDPPKRLDKALSRDVPEQAVLSRTRLARLLGEGAVRVNGAVVTDAKAKVAEGDLVEIAVPVADESHIGPEDIPLVVVYEDDDLVVINKPAGMVVHPAPGTPNGTLVNALLHHCGESLSGVGGVQRPGIVHRIDKETSGLLVVAKSDRAHQGLAAQFEKHTVERYYKAVVYGVPDANDPRLRGVKGVSFESGNIMRITTQLARHKTDRQRQAVLFQGGRHAVTRVRVLESFAETISMVECRLETGRTHQIRIHLSEAGHPIIGEKVYIRKYKDPIIPANRVMLHAAELGFIHPVTDQPVNWELGLPKDFKNRLKILSKSPSENRTPASD